jgi:hypothetical protein
MNKNEIKSLLDSSGFPFQLAVEHNIKSTKGQHGFDVLLTEHPWTDPVSGEVGFIDLVMELGSTRIVVECKRPRGGVRLFTVSHDQQDNIARSRLAWQTGSANQESLNGISEFDLMGPSFQSSTCIIRGKGEDDRTMLERIGSKLLASIDSLILEDALLRNRQLTFPTVYVPWIITSAELVVAKLNPSSVSMEDGTVADFQHITVPFIKFRKSMVSNLSLGFEPNTLLETNKDKERTIVVVNSFHLLETLENTSVSCRLPRDGIKLF